VKNLGDVLYVPVQAISPSNGKQNCYVAHGFKPERRAVEVGEFNDEFIEVKGGLKEGERVLLRAPGSSESDNVTQEKSPGENEAEKPAAPAAPAAATPKAGKA
jgi:hypothetical protein